MFPKKGTIVPKSRKGEAGRYASTISTALRSELGTSARATKTVMHWTGASDRAAKYWLSGARGPDGWHLILLAKNSNAVLHGLLKMAGRDEYELTIELSAARAALARATAMIDALIVPMNEPR
ncbi:MAG: hypothetical protein J0I79_14915 [Mesorhizobium sp.]|uniref:hypothetical protein n=1 Tax=Mesorhizobium sp. TaxID=1871066 RepID=UPI001AC02D17|nr:hypothetical protein [Mesorhizobium sp.]MBN9219241.1 hypothetical protein [Mesorhizobium sp.]